MPIQKASRLIPMTSFRIGRPVVPPVSRADDLWIAGRHKVLCGDGRSSESFATLLDEERVGQVFTDPPYNVAIRNNVSSKDFREFAMGSGEMDRRQYVSFLQALLQRCADVVRDGAILHVCMDWKHVGELSEAAGLVGLTGTVLEKKAEDHLTTTAGGFIYATAVLSDITGFRPREIICDDPLEPKDAMSEARKHAILGWLTSSVLTRFLDPQRNVFILVMHRLAPDDSAGRLAAKPGWHVLSLPLVAEKHERFVSREGEMLMEREPGDYLHPGRMNDRVLAELKAEIAQNAFDSQFQQRPTFRGTGLLSVDRIARYAEEPKYLRTVHS